MKFNRLMAALAAGALLFGACSSDDDSSGGSSGGGESNEYTEAVAAQIKSDGDVPFSDAQVDCLASEFVGALGGASALEEAGITPADIEASEDMTDLDFDIPESAAADIAGAFGSCDIDIKELMLEEMGDEVPEEAKECIADALDEDALAAFFAATLTDPETSEDDLPPEILDSLMACFAG